MKRWILLTGAGGFLGREVVARARIRGLGVLALLRRPEAAPFGAAEGLELLAGDLLDRESLLRAARRLAELDPAGWTVHGAALISYKSRDRVSCQQVNRQGTVELLAALERVGLSRCLLVSSVVALGPARSLAEPVDERGPFRGSGLRSAYVQSKRRAQELALAWGQVPGRDVRAVLPGAIFGPGQSSNTARFLAGVRSRGAPRWVPPGSLSPVALADVAEGLFLALERGAAGQIYLLVEQARSLFELFDDAARTLGTRAPVGSLPAGLWPALVAGARCIDRLWPLGLLAPDALELLGQQFAYDGRRAREELGFCPRPWPTILAEALAPGGAAERGLTLPRP